MAMPPPMKFSRRKIIGLGIAAAAALLGGIAYNLHIAGNRTLQMVTGLPSPVTVSIDGGAPVTLSQPYPVPVPISEGRHRVSLTGAMTDEFDIDLESGFFQRFFTSPVFVLNPGGARLLVYETTVYSKTPDDKGARTHRYAYGEQYSFYPDVAYCFMPFPPSITIDSNSSSVKRSRIGTFDGRVSDAVFELNMQNQLDEAFNLAEWRLRLCPDDTRTLDAYAYMGMEKNTAARALEFLKEGCKRRPVEIPWHEKYQRLRAQDPELEQEYDALLKNDPDNAALLYLRALLEPDDAIADAQFERSIEKDPKNPWPHYALGHHDMSGGEWDKAKAHLSRACELAPDNPDYKDMLHEIRLALGEYAGLEKELREQLQSDPYNLDLNRRLCDVLLAQGQQEQARALAAAFGAKLQTEPDSLGLSESLNEYVLYACGDFARLEQAAAPGTDLQFQALFEQGKLKELAEQYPLKANSDAFWCMLMSAGWSAQNDEDRAKIWREKAIELFGKGNRDAFRIAAVLRSDEPSPVAGVSCLHLPPKQTALVYAILAQRFPEKSAEYKALGRRLNIDYGFPYHFLKRVLAEK